MLFVLLIIIFEHLVDDLKVRSEVDHDSRDQKSTPTGYTSQMTTRIRTTSTCKLTCPGSTRSDNEAISVVIKAIQCKHNMDGSIRPIPEVLNRNMYDLFAAKILVLPLTMLASTIAQLVRSPGGEIGLSGVLKSQAEMVVGAYSEFFDNVEEARENGG